MHTHTPLRIGIADDHGIIRAGLRLILESEEDIEVIFEAGTVHETLERLREHASRCDLLILDIDFEENLSGINILKRVRDVYPGLKILILTVSVEERHFRQAMSEGADGYLLKKDLNEDLIGAVRRLCAGGVFITPNVSYLKVADGGREDRRIRLLSEREVEIIRLTARGLTGRKIGSLLGISERTVGNHKQRIYKKLQLSNVAALIDFARRNGLLDGP